MTDEMITNDEITRALRVLGERVLVRQDDPDDKAAGGIIIPSTVSGGKTRQGYVLDAGSGIEEVTPGDRVLFPTTAGIECELDGEKFRVLREEDLVAVLS